MITPTPASVSKARELLTAWSEEEGCSVVSRYEGDRWDKLVDIIATALDQQIERDAKVAEQPLAPTTYAEQYSMAIAHAIRQRGAR